MARMPFAQMGRNAMRGGQQGGQSAAMRLAQNLPQMPTPPNFNVMGTPFPTSVPSQPTPPPSPQPAPQQPEVTNFGGKPAYPWGETVPSKTNQEFRDWLSGTREKMADRNMFIRDNPANAGNARSLESVYARPDNVIRSPQAFQEKFGMLPSNVVRDPQAFMRKMNSGSTSPELNPQQQQGLEMFQGAFPGAFGQPPTPPAPPTTGPAPPLSIPTGDEVPRSPIFPQQQQLQPPPMMPQFTGGANQFQAPRPRGIPQPGMVGRSPFRR